MGTLRGHDDEVLDVAFDYTGQYLLTASADSTAQVFNASTHQLLSKLEGHEGEISKVCVYCIRSLLSLINLLHVLFRVIVLRPVFRG